MSLRSGKNNNRKLNRTGNGRSMDQRAGFFDLRRDDAAEEESPAGQDKQYYGDDYSGADSGGSGFGSGRRYSGGLRGEDDVDGRPYRERHRVEVNGAEKSGGLQPRKSLDLLDTGRDSRYGRYGTGAASYGDRTGFDVSGPGAGRGYDRSGSGTGSRTAGSGAGRGYDRSGSGTGGRTAGSGAGRGYDRYGNRTNRPTTGKGTGRGYDRYGNRTGSRTAGTEAGTDRYGNGGYGRSDENNTGRDIREIRSERDYTGRDYHSGEYSDRGYSDRSVRSAASSKYEADRDYEGRTGGRVVRGNVPGARRENAGAGSEKEISTDLFVPNTFSARDRKSRVTRVPRSTGGTSGRNQSWRRSPDSRGRGYGPDDDKQSEETSGGFYTPSQYMDSPRRSRGDAGQTAYGRKGRSSSAGRRGSEYIGDEREYFYEEDLPGENLLWDGIGDDSSESISDKRIRQRERIKQEREKELRKMYFRLGAGAAVALLVIIGVIAAAVIRFRDGKTGGNIAQSGQEIQQTENTGEKERSAGGSPDGGATAVAAVPADNQSVKTPDEEDTGGTEADENVTQDEVEKGAREDKTAGQNDSETEDAASQEAEQQESTESTTAEGTPEEPTDEPASQAGTEDAEIGNNAAAAASGAEAAYAHQDEWNLILVNHWQKLPEGFTVETKTLLNGEAVDSRCYDALEKMLTDCQEKSGGIPIVCSSYRPHEKQVRLYNEQVQKLMKEGMTRAAAEKEAGTVVAVPGTSEHELGLAVDICDSENQLLDDSQAETKTQQWLMENCWDYGFILRYPLNKSEITGIIYEPWHYRYVGTEAAKEIRARGICLEEYLAQ